MASQYVQCAVMLLSNTPETAVALAVSFSPWNLSWQEIGLTVFAGSVLALYTAALLESN